MISKNDLIKINDYLWEIPKSFRSDMRVPARIYATEKMLDGIIKDRSLAQLVNVATLPGIQKYALAMPDIHEGYASPIGGVAAIRTSDGIIAPGMQGYDINCGVRLVKSGYTAENIAPYLGRLAGEIQKQVPSGLGMGRQIKFSEKEIDNILEGGAPLLVKQGYGEKEDIENCEADGCLIMADAKTISSHAKNRGRDQVGTLGSGNHFLEIQKVEKIFDEKIAKAFRLFENQIVIMIHCGSRGLGHQVCTDYLREFIPLMENKYKIKVPDREFACVPFNSDDGQRALAASAAAANFAWANRQMILHFVRKVWKKILGEGADLELLYDIAHNIINIEKHKIDGKDTELAVHRKGATRAFPGQPVLIPGSMGTASYILIGAESGQQAFYSSCHGAGRQMSRHEAMRILSGKEVIKNLENKGIVVKIHSARGIAEEAPQAYKDIEEVVEAVHQAGLSQKVARLIPLAVIKGE